MNPFVQNIKLEVTKYIETRINEYQGMTNDEFYASKTQRSERIFFVDRVQRTSVYYVPDDMATMFHSDMTSAGRDMLYYIQRTLRKDMDYVTLDRKDACEQMNNGLLLVSSPRKAPRSSGSIRYTCSTGTE
jgi:hypothetical protein